jgi:hypothetical protein
VLLTLGPFIEPSIAAIDGTGPKGRAMDGPPRRMAMDRHSARPGNREKHRELARFCAGDDGGAFSLVTFFDAHQRKLHAPAGTEIKSA